MSIKNGNMERVRSTDYFHKEVRTYLKEKRAFEEDLRLE
jgi:hypothetical protein